MAASSCSRRHPLVRSGTTQKARRRPELQPSHFLPDERDLADLILFGRRFAEQVRFYPAPDAASGAAESWATFFGSDVAAALAALSKLPVDSFRAFQADLETWLKADPDRPPEQLAAHAKLLFHLPFALIEEAGRRHADLPQAHPFSAQVVELARRELAVPLAGLAGWYKGAVDSGVFADTALAASDYNLGASAGDSRLRFPSALSGVAQREKISEAAIPARFLPATPGGWAALFQATGADTAPFKDAQGPHLLYEQVYDTVEYNLLVSAVERIYLAVARIRKDAAARLESALTDFADHLPHYGLWLSFLQLFRHARAELNGFTARHLDFYYRDVLRLSGRAAEPDKVHLLFELAKGRDAHLLTAGTLFRAGTDAAGKPVSYALENDLVVNRASIAELRALRIDSTGTAGASAELPRASTVAASRDGVGEIPPAADDPAWPAIGPAAAPAARIGFAVADRRLFLREGTRTIKLRFLVPEALTASGPPRWKVRLTGEQGWHEPATAAETNTDDEIVVRLGPEEPAIVPLDPKLHGAEHRPGLPTMEIEFDFDDPAGAPAFARLRDASAASIELQTSASGLKNLAIVAGGGTADPAKSFAPFGAQPGKGATFIIGSSEIFSKPIAQWSLSLDWETPYNRHDFFLNVSADGYNPTVAVLTGGRWAKAAAADIGLDAAAVAGVALPGAELIDALAPQTLENPGLDAGATSGFAKLTLPQDFGHAAYLQENAKALIALANPKVKWTTFGNVNYAPKPDGRGIEFIGDRALSAGRGSVAVGPGISPRPGIHKAGAAASGLSDVADRAVVAPTGALPLKPYEPVLTAVEAGYTTTRGAAASFRHIHPFGSSAQEGSRIFPALPFHGALLIGVVDFRPPARLSLLVQVADGSGDPLRSAPPLSFEYLVGDEWRPFQARDVDDKTHNFATSGILGLAVPEEADTVHGCLPSQLHWFRVSAAEDADALNLILSVQAQAGRAVFVDAGNDPDYLETPLAAGTIAKLVVPDQAVKKVSQPYASSGGRPPERGEAFATRVSERLRHKDRGVTVGDIEALVLEAFPKLHRVKCLGITELERGAGNHVTAENEAKPGSITVVPLPQTLGTSITNPLRPYADQATLSAIEAFLRPRLSPFVRLEVQNAKFEEVQVGFKVRFRPEIKDVSFYIDELDKALVAWLTPWERPGGGDITFGGRLWKSTIVDFVEERPEVDFVTDFRLYHKADADAATETWTRVDVELVEATTSRSILVSAPSHGIEQVSGNG